MVYSHRKKFRPPNPPPIHEPRPPNPNPDPRTSNPSPERRLQNPVPSNPDPQLTNLKFLKIIFLKTLNIFFYLIVQIRLTYKDNK